MQTLVDLRPGSRFGAYRIEATVGRGGMATVYRAEHMHLRRQVALKVPIAEMASDALFRERFIRESRAAAGLVHQNVVAVYDAGEIDGVLYLAMQFVEGEDLARVLRRGGPFEPGAAARVIAQIAAALDAAHERGLVHRDVKPANVLVDGERCYVADFGLTKLTDASAATLTGDVLGTLSYAAPEQIEGAGVDRRADVYALGATAYECCVGMTPFAHRSGAALLYAQLTEAPPRPSEGRPGLPAGIDDVVLKALAKAPGDRFARCGEFAAALSAVISGELVSPARSTPRAERIVLPAPLVRCRAQTMVGRERELEAIAGALRARRVVVALAGEPGIGKTRLAAEAAARAHGDGACVLYGRAAEDPLVPYEPFVEALRGLSAQLDAGRLPAAAGALAPLVPELARLAAPASSGDAGADRYRMFEGVAALLAQVGGTAPVVLVLEDLQWVDKASLLLLRHVLESPRPAQLAAIVSYRPLWVDADHPLRDLLTDVARRHQVENVALSGLSEDDTRRLAASRLGVEPPAGLTAALVARTSGNPLFVEEILREPGPQDDAAATTTALPETVRHVVRRRLERLSPATRDVLAVAALLPQQFSAATLAAVAGDDVEDALEEALAARIVVAHDGHYAFAHSLIRDVLVAGTPGATRRGHHRRIAEVLERRGAEPALLARHFLAAHVQAQALRYSVLAARSATRAHGHEQAAALLSQAQEILDECEPVDPAVRRDLLLELGEARLRASQPSCLETFGAAAELARSTGDADALAEAVLGLAGRATALATDATHAELLEEALSALGPADSELRVRVLARLAQAVSPARALVLSEQALAMAERLDDDTARLAALAGRHGALLASPAQRAPVGRAWVELADRTGELEAAALARHWHVLDLVQAGDRAGADRELILLSELAERLQQPLYRYCALVWQTVFARIDGDDAKVAALTDRALAVAEQMRLPDAAHRFAGEIDARLAVATAITG